jgi:hypothetical protein
MYETIAAFALASAEMEFSTTARQVLFVSAYCDFASQFVYQIALESKQGHMP